MGKIKIGTIVNAVGLKGEIKVYNFSENPDRYEKLEEIYDDRTLNLADRRLSKMVRTKQQYDVRDRSHCTDSRLSPLNIRRSLVRGSSPCRRIENNLLILVLFSII